jgi:hypothetical protein
MFEPVVQSIEVEETQSGAVFCNQGHIPADPVFIGLHDQKDHLPITCQIEGILARFRACRCVE